MVNLSPPPRVASETQRRCGCWGLRTQGGMPWPLPPAPRPSWAQCGGQLVSKAPGRSPLHTPGPGLLTAVASLGASARPLLWLCRGLVDMIRALRVTRLQPLSPSRKLGPEEWGGWLGEGRSWQRSQPVPRDHPPRVSGGSGFLLARGRRRGQTLGVPAFAGPPVCFTARLQRGP